MHCAACAKIIENELSKEAAIAAININPLTEQAELSLKGKPDKAKIDQRLKKLGYTLDWPANLNDSRNLENNELSDGKNKKLLEIKSQKKKLQLAVPLATAILIVFFWSLAAARWNLSPAELVPGSIFLPIVFIVATFVLFGIGRDFLSGALRFFRYGRANMDSLIGIGTGTAYFYSTIIYLFPIVRQVLHLEPMYFFDVTIIVITLVSLGKYLENKAKLRTSDAIEKLITLQTKTALIEIDGQEKEIPLADLKVNDIAIIKPGMKIPADGLIIEGHSSIDEALITGESLPVDKKSGDLVIGATINKEGFLKIKIHKVGSETVLANIIAAIKNAQNSRAPIQKLADKVSGIFVPIILALAVITLTTWLIAGSYYLGWSAAVSLGITCFISILAIACPCALGLATPTGIMVGLGLASKNGLLIKNASSLEKFGRTKIMVFDKTGTITQGQPGVSEIIGLQKNRAEILSLAASLEKNSEHPLALAIISLAKQEKAEFLPTTDFLALPGQGVSGFINGQKYYLGNIKMAMELKISLPENEIKSSEEKGQTIMILSLNNQALGIIAVADKIKPGAVEAIKKIKQAGIKTIMLSGDRLAVAQNIAKQVGLDEVLAEVSPLEKADKIKAIMSTGKITAMVGDGINDAVALVAADIGIAMANGSDIAIESADITIMGGDLNKIILALKISKLTMRKIKQNLFWAFFYNIIAIPIAAGALYPAFKILLSPVIAAGAMSFSSISIVINTLLMKNKKII